MNEIICKFEQISWLKDPQWWAIFAALLLGLAGIFQDWIRKLFWKPSLKIDFQLSPPDSHRTFFSDRNTGKFLNYTYYLRPRIGNNGNYRLEDVEVMVVELSKKEVNGQFKKDEDFLPLNLIWSVSHEITKLKIQPGLFKLLDFGHISETKHKQAQLDYFKLGTNTNIVLELCTEVPPNTGSHLIFPGEYRIKLLIAANNLKPVAKIYSLVLADKWTDDQKEMLENNIFIKEEKSMY